MKIRSILSMFRSTLKETLKDYKYNCRHLKIRRECSSEKDFATLRMYCHMLDKAMNNPSFEKGHSTQVFEKAKVLCFNLMNIYQDDPAFKWTLEIIERFKDAQGTGVPMLIDVNAKDYSLDERSFISEFIKSRISCRNFKANQIEENILKEIVSLAVDAPNGCCRQTVRFHITQDAEIIHKIMPHVAGMTNFTNVPCVAFVCAESSFYDLIDKKLQYVDASLAAENLILASRLYGIYGTMCNFFHASEKDVADCKALLHIKNSENVVMVIALGYPQKLPEKPVRRDVESFYEIV